MTELNNLQNALLLVETDRAEHYEALLRSRRKHRFSRGYLKRRQEIIDIADGKDAAVMWRPEDIRRGSFRTMLVAALILILATIAVIAITKPRIYYVIKEKLECWRITFTQEDSSSGDSEFIEIKPEIPDGFEIVMEERAEGFYYLMLENSEEKTSITYEQTTPDGTSISIDAEQSTNSIEYINGIETVVSRKGDVTTILSNDGTYIYVLDGNVDEELMREMMQGLLDNLK